MQTLKTDTRKRILAVSRSLFLEKGFQGATTREIAAASGVTLSNLYHYYPSKDELFRVLLKPVIDNVPMLIVVLVLTVPVAILAMRLAEKVLRKR